MQRDSIQNTFFVAIVLCLVCAAAVAGSVALLKAPQKVNLERYRKQNVLDAAGLYDKGMSNEQIDITYKQWVVRQVIELPSGKDVTDEYGDEGFDQAKAVDDMKTRVTIKPEDDIAKLKTREYRSNVYIIKTSPANPMPSQYVFPIRGKGLWSIMWGFVSIDADMQTVRGLSYYDQGETPGLGGEVENDVWKKKWDGKLLYNAAGELAIRVAKGNAQNQNQVDGLSGATITSGGVTNMLRYWLGPDGFGSYMKSIREQNSSSGDTSSQPGDKNG